VRTSVDCSQDRGNADSPDAEHDEEPIQGALHFASNELEEKHQYNSVG
jgi:hypothetical protein